MIELMTSDRLRLTQKLHYQSTTWLPGLSGPKFNYVYKLITLTLTES